MNYRLISVILSASIGLGSITTIGLDDSLADLVRRGRGYEQTGIGYPDAPTELGNWRAEMLDTVNMEGAWSIPQSLSITSELQGIFDSISDDIGEGVFTPKALVNIRENASDGSVDHCFLCKGVSDDVDYWCLVFTHMDQSGNVEFCNVFYIDLVQAYDSDIESTCLTDAISHQGVWEHTDSTGIPSDILDAFDESQDPDGLYKSPLGYLGMAQIDGMDTYCFLTTNDLYLGANNGLSLTYISRIDGASVNSDEDVWIETRSASFTIRNINECPEQEEPESLGCPFYTYGGWTVPSSMDLDMVPEECLDLISSYEGGRYEAVSYLMYKEFLHPDHTSLLRVFMCSTDGEFNSILFVEEDQSGELSVTGVVAIDYDECLLADSIIECEEPEDSDWYLSDSTDIPTFIADAYWDIAGELGGWTDYGVPEVLLAQRDLGNVTDYLFISREGTYSYGSNDDITIAGYGIDSNGECCDTYRISVDIPDLYRSVAGGGDTTGTSDPSLTSFLEVLVGIDPEYSEALMDDSNISGNSRHADVDGIELTVTTYDSPDEAQEAYLGLHDFYGSDIVYTGNNYFYADSMAGSGSFFGYVFCTGNDVITVSTYDIMNVTTVADIGDSFAQVMP